eukprot:5194735-Amphidinium_carterae.1
MNGMCSYDGKPKTIPVGLHPSDLQLNSLNKEQRVTELISWARISNSDHPDDPQNRKESMSTMRR